MTFYKHHRYLVVHGRMEELKDRFAEAKIPMWKKAGIEPVAFFEPRWPVSCPTGTPTGLCWR